MRVLGIPLAVLVVGGALAAQSLAGGRTHGPCGGAAVHGVLAAVNVARADAGQRPLGADGELVRAATARAAAVARLGALSHAGWVGAVRASGYTAPYLGENLAYGYATPEGVVGAWLGSAAHRANVLRETFTAMGVACTTDRNGVIWWAQEFGGGFDSPVARR